MDRHGLNNPISALIGFGLGICLSLLAGGILYVNRTNNIPPSTSTSAIPESTASPPPANIIVGATSDSSTAEPSIQEILVEAEDRLFNGESEKVKELLLPSIESWPYPKDKAAGYKLLGDAEVALGHFQLAVPYYEKVYFYEPSPDNLFTIAITQDMGGNLCEAFKYYQELDAWDDVNTIFDREFVKTRIKDIACTLGTKTP